MRLHVSSTMCSSSGGQNCIIQHLVSSNSVGVMIHIYYILYILYIIYYTASGIITPTESDDTRCCIISILTSWWWAQQCLKHVDAYNKLIIKQEFVH